MSEVFYIFSAIIAVFFVLLIAKELFVRKTMLCLICASVSLTWIALLVLYRKGVFDGPIILSMLMGQSIVGIFYLMERKVKGELHLFKVPFLLTLTFAFYSLIDFPDDFAKAAALLGILWAALLLLLLFRKNGRVNSLVKKILECCRRW